MTVVGVGKLVRVFVAFSLSGLVGVFTSGYGGSGFVWGFTWCGVFCDDFWAFVGVAHTAHIRSGLVGCLSFRVRAVAGFGARGFRK